MTTFHLCTMCIDYVRLGIGHSLLSEVMSLITEETR